VVSEVSISLADWLSMSGVWFDARLLSTTASTSDRRVQIQSFNDANAAIHRLWFSRIHQKCNHRPASAPSFYSAVLYVVLAYLDDLFLDLSQHAVVSVFALVPLNKSLLSINRAD